MTVRVFLVAALSLLLSNVHAETALEHEIFGRTMPHKRLAGRDVLVHWVRLQGSAQPPQVNAAELEHLKQDVQKCAASRRQQSLSVNLVTQWPDRMQSLRADRYVTAAYEIDYESGAVYGGLTEDCALIERRSETAVLRSMAGVCRIDLVAKTAHGQCDLQAHVAARAPRHLTMAQIGTERAEPPPNLPPEIAAQLAAISPKATGISKTIAGLRCEEETLNDERFCVAHGGSFRGKTNTVLEQTSSHGIQLQAIEAALDAKVDGELFAPHLAGGFRIEQRGGVR